MSHSKDTLFLINRNGWQVHWDSAVSIHQLEAADLSLFGNQLTPAWGWVEDFVLGWLRGACQICIGKAAKSLGQKAPGFCRRNVSGSHVRIITAASWYFLWRRQNEIIKSLHWTGYAVMLIYRMELLTQLIAITPVMSINQQYKTTAMQAVLLSKEHTPNIE